MGRMSQATPMPAIRVTASSARVTRANLSFGVDITFFPEPGRRGGGRSVATRRLLRLVGERGVAELGIQIDHLRPVRDDDLGEVALRVEHLLEERIFRRVAVEHDVGRAYEFREE